MVNRIKLHGFGKANWGCCLIRPQVLQWNRDPTGWCWLVPLSSSNVSPVIGNSTRHYRASKWDHRSRRAPPTDG